MAIRIGVCGASGKMGKIVIERVNQFKSCKISAKFTSTNHINDLDNFCCKSDVIIDFSNTDILKKLLDCAFKYNNKLIIGTTGLANHHLDYLNNASANLAILYSANMSLGANLMAIIAEKISKILNKNYDIEIIDKHHRSKKDAPSGTAIMFSKIITSAKNLEFDKSIILNCNEKRSRADNEIGISSIRGGNIYGEHEILFLGDNDIVTIKHQALNRVLFADGAIQAAIWLFAQKNPGLYSMMDVFRHLI